MKGMILLISVLVLGACQGCETLRGAESGARKDVANTGEHIKNGVNAALEADREFQEKYW